MRAFNAALGMRLAVRAQLASAEWRRLMEGMR